MNLSFKMKSNLVHISILFWHHAFFITSRQTSGKTSFATA